MLTGNPVQNTDEAESAAKIFLERGCRTVIITLGEQGIMLASKANPTPLYIPAMKVNSVDTTVTKYYTLQY